MNIEAKELSLCNLSGHARPFILISLLEDSLPSHLISLSSGLTYLDNNKFHPKTVMPICLPTSEDFEDTNKQVMAVGMGITRDMKFQGGKRCFTDGFGPEVLQQCA